MCEPPSRPAATAGLILAFAALLAACVAPGVTPGTQPPPPGSFAFALVGDAPYGDADEPRFDQVLRDIEARAGVRFALHAGDIKGGTEPCTDALLQRRIAQIASVARPLLLTPGDNEWTDCHREGAGRFLPTERLEYLRRLAWPDPRATLGAAPALRLDTQADDPAYRHYVENAMFVHEGVLFASVHVVGSGNGLAPWSGIDGQDSESAPRADRRAEFAEREAAALAWLDAAFDRARREGLAAVVLLMHADMLLEKSPAARERAGFNRVITRLRQGAARYGGPVLLAHGDSHRYRVDHPLSDAGDGAPAAPNLLRVEAPGYPTVGWVDIRFAPGRDGSPFEFELNSVP